MKMDDMILISVDDHITEPPDMFDQHTPPKYKGKMPKSVRQNSGADYWVVESEGIECKNSGLNAVAGRRPEDYGMDPHSYDEMRKGCYDVHARIDDQNVNGILATLNFGTFPAFSGTMFLQYKDTDLALATVQAYNDWHIDEWCAAYPGRFIPLGILPMWDVDLCSEEVKRLKAKGCNSITLPPNPTRVGLPSIHSGAWDPLWDVCNDLGVITCLHIGDATGAITSPDAPVDAFITNMPVSLFSTASDLVWSPVLRKYDNIKFALTEGGAGWAPHFMERADYTYKHHHAWTHQDFGDKLPSEVFLEHVYTCFIDDKTAIRDRHAVGLDGLTWECDYPHSDCTFPNSPEVLWESVKDIPDEDINKITYKNAMRAYDFDPFQHVKKEDCTVGALRAKATHVDTSYMETGRSLHEAIDDVEGIITFEAYNRVNALDAPE